MLKVDGGIAAYFFTVAMVFCFVFQQFGPSFHFSIGALGLLLFVVGFHKAVNKAYAIFAFAFVFACALSFFWVLSRYGYVSDFARFLRFEFCLFILLLYLRKDFYIPSVGSFVFYIPAFFICVFLIYQVLIDKSLQIPSHYYAMGENLADGDSVSAFAYHADKLRGNGIYSEPSYFGMVAVVLFAILLQYPDYLSKAFALLIFVSVVISGSGLGIFGVVVVGFYALVLGRFNVWRAISGLFLIFLVFLGLSQVLGFLSTSYEFTFYERLLSASSSSDGSGTTRFITPYYIVLESIKNGDILGVPVDTFNHYLYTNLYTEQGDYPGHNGLWSLIFQFGLVGVLLIIVLLSRCANFLEMFLLVLICSQNGNILTYEKVFSIVFALSMIRGVRYVNQVNKGLV